MVSLTSSILFILDFQDTSKGIPANTNFDGKSWMPIGWDKYDVNKGYGWNSQYMGLPNTQQPDVALLEYVNFVIRENNSNFLQLVQMYRRRRWKLNTKDYLL